MDDHFLGLGFDSYFQPLNFSLNSSIFSSLTLINKKCNTRMNQNEWLVDNMTWFNQLQQYLFTVLSDMSNQYFIFLVSLDIQDQFHLGTQTRHKRFEKHRNKSQTIHQYENDQIPFFLFDLFVPWLIILHILVTKSTNFHRISQSIFDFDLFQ